MEEATGLSTFLGWLSFTSGLSKVVSSRARSEKTPDKTGPNALSGAAAAGGAARSGPKEALTFRGMSSGVLR
jgi:hypothetical protein